MYSWFRQNLSIFLIGGLLALFLGAAFFLRVNNQNKEVAQNLGDSKNKITPSIQPSGVQGSLLPQPSGQNYPLPTYGMMTLRDLEKILPTTFPSPTNILPTQNILPLPEVVDAEIVSISGGTSGVEDYMARLNQIFAQEKFLNDADYKKILNENIIFPAELVKQELQQADKLATKESLVAWSKFNSEIIGLYKNAKIKNSASATIKFAKTIIGFNELQGELINKGIAYADGSVDALEAQNYLDAFLEAKNFYAGQIRPQMQSLAKSSDNFFINTARAAGGTPFGGKISYTYSCCNGLLITLSAPSAGTYMIYWPFLASPLLYEFRATHAGAWLLGLSQSPGICRTYAYCAYTISASGGSIIMTGTSQ
ncbi:MAG: hypothetical protein AAB824_00170 [Patescibacteria group bacterium]